MSKSTGMPAKDLVHCSIQGNRRVLGPIEPFLMNSNKSTTRPPRSRARRGRPKARARTTKQNKQSTQLIMPPRLWRTLRYNDAAYVRNNPANNFLVYSFRANDLFDPDPLILSGSISGFKEIMQFYQYYRVMHCQATITLCNLEAFPIMYGMVFSQTNLTGIIATRDDAINALENNFSTRARILAAKGGMDRATLTKGMSMNRLLGASLQYAAESNYTGNGIATPTTPLWLNFIVASPTGSALTNGYASTTVLSFHSEFFGLINLRS